MSRCPKCRVQQTAFLSVEDENRILTWYKYHVCLVHQTILMRCIPKRKKSEEKVEAGAQMGMLELRSAGSLPGRQLDSTMAMPCSIRSSTLFKACSLMNARRLPGDKEDSGIRVEMLSSWLSRQSMMFQYMFTINDILKNGSGPSLLDAVNEYVNA